MNESTDRDWTINSMSNASIKIPTDVGPWRRLK
jgi:hypothetical protein